MKTPLTIITGPLGSGKTTLLRHILATYPRKIAVLMNEFGEIAIDSKVIEGKNVRIAELGGGCVCCSLVGEFEAAVEEILDTVAPEVLILETTGVAEPDALIYNVQENVPRVRLDSVITVMDADALLRFPQIGHTTRLQVEAADLILLNKIDLIAPADLEAAREKLQLLNPQAILFTSTRGQVSPDLLFGLVSDREIRQPAHSHLLEFDSFTYSSSQTFDRDCFESFLQRLGNKVYRAKGFVKFPDRSYLFNFVAGRWELEPFPYPENILVFIGSQLNDQRSRIMEDLKKCGSPDAVSLS
ncbi:MAG: GTP-binding protein [Acidobacteria bacterium]|nr:GTP-binding protein [Acidobacteriota bacterium]